MGDLVAGVEGFVIGFAGLPHVPQDFEPAIGQAAQGGGVGLALLFFLLVIGLGPGTLAARQIGPQVQGGAEGFVAGAERGFAFAADDGEAPLARLLGDRRGAGEALQALGGVEAGAVVADLAQQPRGELGAGGGQ